MALQLSNYRELKVWHKSYRLCLFVYQITRDFPMEERFGLTQQIRRAAISIPSNIAEGYGRKTTQQYIYGLYLANGSLCELETQLMLSHDLGYYSRQDYSFLKDCINEISRMLRALIKSLEAIQTNE